MSHDSNKKAELQAKLNQARHNLGLARTHIYLAENAAERNKARFIQEIEEAKVNTKGFSEVGKSFVIHSAESRLRRCTTLYDAILRRVNSKVEVYNKIVEGYKAILKGLKEEQEGKDKGGRE